MVQLMDSLDQESTKVLNSLVQSVILTQKENEDTKMKLLSEQNEILSSQK